VTANADASRAFDTVVFDFYGTLGHATQWLSLDNVLAEHGYELADDVRRRWWFESEQDGLEHVEHSHSEDAYAQWQRNRMLGMLAECDVHPGEYEMIIDKLRTGREKLSSQAADRTRGLVGQGLERSAEALANVGKLVGDTADGLDERLGPEYGEYARKAATAIENAANSIASKDADELIDDTREFVRQSPGIALAGAAIVGFAVARLIKSGLAREDEGDGGGRRRGKRES